MEQFLKGKTVLVTGAGWGIGAATALLYAACGAKVIISDTSQKEGRNILAKIKNQKGNAIYIRADVSSPAECEELVKTTIHAYGSIDIACNNSVVFGEAPHPGEWDDVAGLNITSLNNCMQYEIEAMQKQGGGVIVNTQSIISAIAPASSSQYIETKYGTIMRLYKFRGTYPAIHIHTIAPAFISKMNMYGTIQEVARLILWLSSDETHRSSTVFNDTN
jgi:NAD(P)-dependent dehydrogenase (short-subunit alcohol dehydrogenase family)